MKTRTKLSPRPPPPPQAVSLNDSDSAVTEYYEIQCSTNITNPKRGKSIIRPHHHLTGACKVANGLVDHLFAFADKDGKPTLDKDENQEMLLFEPARLFRFIVEVFDLKAKALGGEAAFAITDDAAAVCTGGNEAGQCIFGIKPVDMS